MEENIVLFIVLGICLTLAIACILFLISKKVKFLPYTVLLTLAGIAFSTLHIEPLEAIKLTPESVFLIFLPILLFESAFNFDYREFKRILAPGFLLASVGLLISAAIIAWPLMVFFNIPFASAFMYGCVISSTDPIAVLSMFKQLGVPKKLQLLVDGESFLNDGTSVIMFRIMLGFATGSVGAFGADDVLGGGLSFLYVFFGGLIVGGLMGYLFSEIIFRIRNVSSVEITLTILLAHLVFILSEELLHVSGIIGVLAAGLVLGNYGRSKISPKIGHNMHQIWDLLVFITTSIIFFLIGYEIQFQTLGENLEIIIVSTLTLLIARAISVYVVCGYYNVFVKKKAKIPVSWMHIANWGGLRGALPLIVMISLPLDYEYRELFIQLVIGAVLFTLLINALTIEPLIKLLKLDQVNKTNEIEVKITEFFILRKFLKKLEILRAKKEIGDEVYDQTVSKLQVKVGKNKELVDYWMNNKPEEYRDEIDKVLRRYCLQVEKSVYHSLFKKDIIPEILYNIIKRTILDQIERLNEGSEQFNDVSFNKNYSHIKIGSHSFRFTWLEKLVIKLNPDITLEEKLISYNYKYHKARLLGDEKVIQELQDFLKYSLLPERSIRGILMLYKEFEQYNTNTLQEIQKEHPKIAHNVEVYFAKKEADHLVESILSAFGEEERISTKSIQVFDFDLK